MDTLEKPFGQQNQIRPLTPELSDYLRLQMTMGLIQHHPNTPAEAIVEIERNNPRVAAAMASYRAGLASLEQALTNAVIVLDRQNRQYQDLIAAELLSRPVVATIRTRPDVFQEGEQLPFEAWRSAGPCRTAPPAAALNLAAAAEVQLVAAPGGDVCPECGGTGEVRLFTSTKPCSLGCPRKPA
jgi:hypothetical protein